MREAEYEYSVQWMDDTFQTVQDERDENQIEMMQRELIIRRGDGLYSINSMATQFANRDRAHVFENYGETPSEGIDDMFVEILALEGTDAVQLRVPEAIAEFSQPDMQNQYDDVTRDDRDKFEYRLIVRHSDGHWRRSNFDREAVTTDRQQAHIYAYYARTPNEQRAGAVIEILPPVEMEGWIPPVWANKTSPTVGVLLHKHLFKQEFLTLFCTAPTSEFVRGWILKVTKQLPPEDIDTLDKLEAWLQSIQPKRMETPAAPTAQPVPVPTVETVSITVAIEQVDSGSASYSVNERGVVTFGFTEEELNDLVDSAVENGTGIDGLYAYAKDTLDEEIWDRTAPDMEEVGDYTYHDHDSDGEPERRRNTVDSFALKQRLAAWVRANRPDDAATLGL